MPKDPVQPHFSFSLRVLFLIFMIVAAGFAALANLSEWTLMWARTLAAGALIAATVAWTVSTGRTKAFCKGYAAAGWSYFLLAHSEFLGPIHLGYSEPFDGLLHVHLAKIIRYAISGYDNDGFAETLSFVFALFLSCMSGAVTSHFSVVAEHESESV